MRSIPVGSHLDLTIENPEKLSYDTDGVLGGIHALKLNPFHKNVEKRGENFYLNLR